MRWIAGVVAVLAVFAAPAGAARKLGCGPATARTVTQSSTIRVFVQKGSYFACWRRTHGKPVDLLIERQGPLRLRGRFLAYVSVDSCPRSCEFSVGILDVERRRTVVFAPYLPGAVRTLVATRGGAAAFLADDGHERYIQKLDWLGAEEIDRGVDVRSLTLHRGRLHWLHGQQARDDHIAHVRSCGPRGAFTEALSKRLRVYEIDPYGDEEYESYACFLGSHAKPLLLGVDTPGHSAYSYHDDFLLRGEHVVWLEVGCYLVDCNTEIHSADVRTRAIRDGQGSWPGLKSFWANNRGFAAELFSTGGTSPDYTLYTFDSTGENSVDSGAGIDPSSIAIYPDALVWRHDGEQRSAPLR